MAVSNNDIVRMAVALAFYFSMCAKPSFNFVKFSLSIQL